MSREGALLVMLAVAIVLIGLMGLGWRRRTRRDRGLAAPSEAVPAGSLVRAEFPGLYVATTAHGVALERLAVRGLGFRARADLTVTDDGVVLHLRGQDPIFLSRERLTATEQATVAIDRVVERDGLTRLSWRLDDGTVVDSYFRPQGASARAAADAITALLTSPTPTGTDA
ncbi:hypothetical protein LQ938_07550 [Microbacterium sp. cx-55]|uniref:PH-like domain-containing protein n=1 Tax=Microbacterium sp. cx-55 TaxID=2875948 RepID=UPI001CC0AD93|nr:hypothetical protein [Microbacterium sp. cx-55]MBZ4486399.1 hypothetical protein [Microbacterium sp. cx-55]UGB36626.1 hypothetical protein LQ938_07550 [Microbacterium sp. cx-55]